MTPKTGLVEDKLDGGGIRFTDVADMSEKRERTKTLTTVQRDHVHEALAVQEDRDDHVAAAGQDKAGYP